MTALEIPLNRTLGGTGVLSGPASGAQFDRVVELVGKSLTLLAELALNGGVENENGLNSKLSRFITNMAYQEKLPYFAQRESMEDETRGNSPAPDIGIYLYIKDIAEFPPKVTVFEGKRLTTSLERKRRREYVVGHEEEGKHICCGGIERFKLSIHARDFDRAGIIGYVQDGSPDSWFEQINAWISELSTGAHDPKWSERERLEALSAKGRLASCTSMVCRRDDQLHLTHLWIVLRRDKGSAADRLLKN